MPLKILFLSSEGNGADMAWRLDLEGHKIRLFIGDEDCRPNFDGLVDKTERWESDLPWCDYVIVDDNHDPKVFPILKASGKPVFGMAHGGGMVRVSKTKFPAHMTQVHLEDNRSMAQDVMRHYGIGEDLESESYDDVGDVLEHIKQHQAPHVVKPESDTSDKGTTYVGELEDGSDVIGWLETLPLRPEGKSIKKIELQERKDGVEVAVSGWFTGGDFLNSININFEHKRIAAGDLGFMTGEMGTVMYNEMRPNSTVKMFTESLGKMKDFLANVDYRGQIDLNCIINKDGLFPLEFTPRLGYPSSYIEHEIQGRPWGEFFYDIARGKKTENVVNPGWAIGVCLVGEGFPFWDVGRKRMGDLPILGLNESNLKHLHGYDIALKDRRFMATGPLPLVATAIAPALDDAQDNVYESVIPSVHFSSMYYRNDIGDGVYDDVENLNKLGWDIQPADMSGHFKNKEEVAAR